MSFTKNDIKITDNIILERWNHCIETLDNCYEQIKNNDIIKFQEKLRDASSSIYEVIEWSLKFYFKTKVTDAFFQRNYKAIQSGNIHEMITVLKLVPNYNKSFPAKFNIDLFSDLKKVARNNHVHQGEIPSFTSFISVVESTEIFLKTTILENNINSQMINIPKLLLSEETINFKTNSWDILFSKCSYFKHHRDYFLICDEMLIHGDLVNIIKPPWKAIIDLDSKSDRQGLLFESRECLKKNSSLHILTSYDNTPLALNNAVNYLLPLGLIDRPETMSRDYRDWMIKFSSNFHKQIDTFQTISQNKPIDIVIIIQDKASLPYIKLLCDRFSSFGQSVSFIFCSNDQSLLDEFRIYEGITYLKISIEEIISGIKKYDYYFSTEKKEDKIILPAIRKGEAIIEKSLFYWLSEDLEIVYKNIHKMEIIEEDFKLKYYKGYEITYNNLFERDDIDRDITNDLSKKIEKDLILRETTRFNLFYFPGQGATTISKRIAWNLHESHPVAFLQSINNNDTSEKLYKLYSETQLTPLVIIETNKVSLDDMESLYTKVKAANFPCVFLQITRKINQMKSSTSRTFVLPEVFTENELELFVRKYSTIVPGKKEILASIIKERNPETLNPFYIGLVSFERDFVKLSSYVKNFLNSPDRLQFKILAYISFIYLYGHQAISSQFFCNLLSIPHNQTVNIFLHITNEMQRLIILDSDNKIRPMHYSVAKEIFIQFLTDHSTSKENWLWNLSDFCVEIIQYSAQMINSKNYSSSDLMRKIFIDRENESLLGKESGEKFATVIDLIPTKEGKVKVFHKLTECFPAESHFWAHLARFYSTIEKKYSEAIEYIDKAIALSSEEDTVLYHMKGICIREIIYHKIMNNIFEIDEMYDTLGEARKSFLKAIELNRFSEFGYISLIQLNLRVVEFGFKNSNHSSIEDFFGNEEFSYYRKLFDESSSLIEDVKKNFEGQSESRYLVESENKLYGLFGDYSTIIERWNNLLQKNVEKPPIKRQLARAYLKQIELGRKVNDSIERIISLMEDNIKEDPTNEKNIKLWFIAYRQKKDFRIDYAIERLSYWRSNFNNIESIFYLYVLHSIKAIDKYAASTPIAIKLIEESSKKSRYFRNRDFCSEWYSENNVSSLKILNYKNLSLKVDEIDYHDVPTLTRLQGKVASRVGPEKGVISLSCGLTAFFVPARGNKGNGIQSNDLNKNVSFYLGFSNDGLIAKNVIII